MRAIDYLEIGGGGRSALDGLNFYVHAVTELTAMTVAGSLRRRYARHKTRPDPPVSLRRAGTCHPHCSEQRE
jgi:hypothetical protein